MGWAGLLVLELCRCAGRKPCFIPLPELPSIDASLLRRVFVCVCVLCSLCLCFVFHSSQLYVRTCEVKPTYTFPPPPPFFPPINSSSLFFVSILFCSGGHALLSECITVGHKQAVLQCSKATIPRVPSTTCCWTCSLATTTHYCPSACGCPASTLHASTIPHSALLAGDGGRGRITKATTQGTAGQWARVPITRRFVRHNPFVARLIRITACVAAQAAVAQ